MCIFGVCVCYISILTGIKSNDCQFGNTPKIMQVSISCTTCAAGNCSKESISGETQHRKEYADWSFFCCCLQ